jgi:acyl-coenzyme A synthetase/AMP-(fatty) acid ligase
MMRFAAIVRLKNAAVIGALFAVVFACFGAATAQSRRAASEAEYPLVGDDGQRLPNHAVRLLGPIDNLPGVVVVGNPKGRDLPGSDRV